MLLRTFHSKTSHATALKRREVNAIPAKPVTAPRQTARPDHRDKALEGTGRHGVAWPRGCILASAGNSASAASTSTDVLRSELRSLEAERDTAVTTAESCAKTATKLAEMARLLEQLAFDKVQQRDEAGARSALKEKASVTEAMDKNSNKADINYKLAAVLAAKIASKQSALLATLRSSSSGQPTSAPTRTSSSSARAPASGSPSYPAYPSAPASPPSSPRFSSGPDSSGYSGSYSSGYQRPESNDSAPPSSPFGPDQDTPRWKWQKSLEEAKERLKAQEVSAGRDVRMAKLSGEERIAASIAAAQERIAGQVSQSVREAQERLRAQDSSSQNTLAAAQARLRARDDEVLAYVRRVMSRYRAGEFVSEEELEFAFKQLEQRFM